MKEIADAHGGRFWVESALGEGSTFFLALPRAAVPSKGDAPTATAVVAPTLSAERVAART